MIVQERETHSNIIEYMTALRGIACLMVLLVHSVQILTPYGIYVSGCGKMGVWFFLVSSGFLTIYPYEQRREKTFSILKYYKKRFLKIYPVYAAVLLLSYMVGYFDSWKQFVLHLVFVQGTGHFWYMPVIAKMYLIMPVFIYARKKIKKTSFYITGMTILAVVCCLFFPYWKYEENSTCLWWYFPIFVFGFLLAVVYNQIRISDNWVGDGFFWGIFCIFILITPFMRKLIWHIEPSSYLQNKYLYIGFLWCLVIIGCKISCVIGKLLDSNRLLGYIGKISYPLYLFHFIVFMKMKLCMIPVPAKVILGFVISFLLAAFVEVLENTVNRKFQKRII